MADAPLISNVADTARWVAYYRALETERADAIFRDPFARRLAGPQGKAIVEGMPKGRAMGWPMVVRTAVMDEIILRVVAAEGVDTVVNLAAGLDARPWRLPLPATLRWVDVDQAVMVDLKRTELAAERPACRYEAIRADLADAGERRAALGEALGAATRALVITEGLLVYLGAGPVGELAADLRDAPAATFWLMDLASPALLTMLEKSWGPVVRAGNAPFRFGPAEGTRFFAPFGWRELEFRSTFHEGIRLGRSFPMARFWAWLGGLSRKKAEEMRRFSGIALLGRSG